MSKLAFTPVNILTGLLAGFVASKLFDLIWSRAAHGEAPEPDQRGISWPALIAAMTLEGAILRVTRAVMDRGARIAFARATGSWPGADEPEEA